MEKVRFHFDPRCPWCWQTSRWARRLEELGEIDVDWDVFSLDVVNAPEGTDPLELDGSPQLQTAVVVLREHGPKALGRLYAALGERQFHSPPPPDDPVA